MLNFSSGFPSIFIQLRTAGVFGYGKKKVKSIHILLSDLRKLLSMTACVYPNMESAE